MIFLDYLYTLPNSTSGGDQILIDTAGSVNGLTPLLLFFIFFVIFLSGIGRQKARTGIADYPLWGLIASMCIFMVSLIMTMVEGLIRLDWLVIVTVITIFFGIWFFLDKRSGEV